MRSKRTSLQNKLERLSLGDFNARSSVFEQVIGEEVKHYQVYKM